MAVNAEPVAEAVDVDIEVKTCVLGGQMYTFGFELGSTIGDVRNALREKLTNVIGDSRVRIEGQGRVGGQTYEDDHVLKADTAVFFAKMTKGG